MNRNFISVILVILAATLLWAGSLMSAPTGTQGGDYADSEVLVKYRQGVTHSKKAQQRGTIGASVMKEFPQARLSRLKLEGDIGVQDISLRRIQNILSVERLK